MTCAYAVRGALKKIPGVESVDVSLNKGLATVKLAPGNTAQPQEFWSAIRRNGFTPKETHVQVRGEIEDGKRLKVTGSGQVFELQGDLAAFKTSSGKTVTLEGVLTPGKDNKAPVPLEVRQCCQ